MEIIPKNKIIIEIPKPPITALVFEGGGVKGLAYSGAFQTLKQKNGLLDNVKWVAGSSAGAMTALMVALNYSPEEIEQELTEVDFSKFTDSQSNRLSAIFGYITKLKNISSLHQGMHDGKELYNWVKKIVKNKLNNELATFSDLQEKMNQSLDYKDLFIIVTNADKNKTEIFSYETTPRLQLADAVLVSMSIPGYFWTRYLDEDEMQRIDWEPTKEKINKKTHRLIPYVDGSVLNNYPVEIFCDRKYWLPEYYGLAKTHSYNPSIIGFRVDSKTEVDFLLEEHNKILKEDTSFPVQEGPMQYIEDKVSSLLQFFTSDLNKIEQFSRVTIGIKDCDVKTTDFKLTGEKKSELKEEGKKAAQDFYSKFLKENIYKKLVYNNLSDLEDDYKKIESLIQTIRKLNSKDKHFYEFIIPVLELKIKLINNKITELSN